MIRILTSICNFKKLRGKKINESVFDDVYDDIEKNIELGDRNEINYNKYALLIKEAKDFLEKRLKGITFDVVLNIKDYDNTKEYPMDGSVLNLKVKEKSPKSEDYMYIIENADREIKGNKIVIPSILPQDLLEKYVIPNLPEESNKILKIIKYVKTTD